MTGPSLSEEVSQSPRGARSPNTVEGLYSVHAGEAAGVCCWEAGEPGTEWMSTVGGDMVGGVITTKAGGGAAMRSGGIARGAAKWNKARYC